MCNVTYGNGPTLILSLFGCFFLDVKHDHKLVTRSREKSRKSWGYVGVAQAIIDCAVSKATAASVDGTLKLSSCIIFMIALCRVSEGSM